MVYRKNDDILLDIFRWKVYEKFVSINLHVAKLVHRIVSNILKLGPLHIAIESRSHSGGLIFGSGFDSAELVAGQLRTKMESEILVYPSSL